VEKRFSLYSVTQELVPEQMVLERHDPFLIPDEEELTHEYKKPRWWYAQQLHIAGASWEEIAKALGYESEQTCREIVRRARRKRSREEMEDILDLELDRLDRLQLSFWRQAIHGDVRAGNMVMQIMTMRAKYLGLEKKTEATQVTNNAAFFIGGTEEDYVSSLKKAREMAFNKPKEIE